MCSIVKPNAIRRINRSNCLSGIIGLKHHTNLSLCFLIPKYVSFKKSHHNIMAFSTHHIALNVIHSADEKDNQLIDSKATSPCSDEFFDIPPASCRPSTTEDEQCIIELLNDIFSYQDRNVVSWIVEEKIKRMCGCYKYLLKPHREAFLKVLATSYAVNHELVSETAKRFCELDLGSGQMIRSEDRLKNLLSPQYSWLFRHLARLEGGVKFLVDMRTDVLMVVSELEASASELSAFQQLNTTLRDLLSLWFSVGFLNLERVTWKSPCEMLQKISEYEAVHPVRSWTDLKRRVGPYRRCFVYTHSSMPGEPLVVLHTALCDHIAASVRGIVKSATRLSVDAAANNFETGANVLTEDPSNIKAAIFYSITSTQKGLQGIELGNYLIKRVVHELQLEFPLVTQFSSLSPIPGFRAWLLDRFKVAKKGEADSFLDQWCTLKAELGCETWDELSKLFKVNAWQTDVTLIRLLETPLMNSCAYYLYIEKRRGYAYDSVANFHLRNGAVMWRLNWLADPSPRGLTNSCGIMVNYRYFLDDSEENSRNYVESKQVAASEQVLRLAGEKMTSKM